jgi:DTW domain-containing protein YfiP
MNLFAEGLCQACGLSLELCVCSSAPKLVCQTEILIIRHYRESHLSSSTAKLIQLAIPETVIRSRGAKEDKREDYRESPGKKSFYLFPSEDALEIDTSLLKQFPGPHRLIVPDGSWTQARKIYKRDGFEGKVQCVKFSSSHLKEKPGEYYLRHAPNQEGLSTFEATARALGLLENPELESQLHQLFIRFVHRSLYMRGLALPLRRMDKI